MTLDGASECEIQRHWEVLNMQSSFGGTMKLLLPSYEVNIKLSIPERLFSLELNPSGKSLSVTYNNSVVFSGYFLQQNRNIVERGDKYHNPSQVHFK